MRINSTMSRVVFYLVLFGGIALTAFGLWQQRGGGVTTLAFRWFLLPDYSIGFIGIGIVIECLSRVTGLSRLVFGGIIATVIALLTNALWALLVVVWFAFASCLLGQAMLTLLRINKDKLSNVTIALVGAGIYGTVIGLLAHFPINYPSLYGILLAVPVVLGWRSLTNLVRSYRQYVTQPSELKWLDLLIVLVALVHFSVALMPEVGHDALAMHLFIPAHLVFRHEWSFDVTTYVWAVMPTMGDWIYSVVYMLAGETAARMMNVGFIFVLGWLIRDLVMWAGGNAVGARWAVLLYLSTPLTFTESNSVFIESVWTAFIVAGSLSIFKLLQPHNNHSAHLPIAGFLLGGALASKAVSFTILPVLLLLLVWRYRSWAQRNQLYPLLLGLVLFFAVGIIPYVTAWYLTGNPVFPFFNKVFQSPFYFLEDFDVSTLYGKGLAWNALYQTTFHSEKFIEGRSGAPGFQWMLLFFPAVLALLFSKQYRGVILFVIAVLAIALTFQSITYLRYIFPSFVWIAAGIGIALSTSAYKDTVFFRRALSIVSGIVVLLNLVYFKSATNYGELSLSCLMSSSGREAYLNDRLPVRNAIGLVNYLNVLQSPVAVFSHPLTAGLNSDGLYPSWYNYQFQTKVLAATTTDDIAKVMQEKGVDYVIFDSTWGSADKRKLIEEATDEIAELGTSSVINVRKLKSSYQFQTELLKNPDFLSQEGWLFPARKSDQSLGGIAVADVSYAYQLVPVSAGHRYQNSVTVQCPERTTQARIQVNWFNAKSHFIDTNIRVFECTAAKTTWTMEVKAPSRAVQAQIYASGHTSVPVIFNKVSFRQ